MPCERRPLAEADAADSIAQLVAETAERLRRGELCALPTETVYGLAVLPSHADAVARARAMKGRAQSHPFTYHIAAMADLHRLAANPSARIRRLTERYWPGPLTVVLPARSGEADATVGLRLPAHAFTQQVIAACGEPLWLSSINETGKEPLVDPDAIAAQFGEHLDLLIDDGPSPLGNASTVVRDLGDHLEVLRAGILDHDQVLHTAAELTLFVCTGNTCRSPLAEALARDLTARTLGIEPTEVLARGHAFLSAGTATHPGMPASEGSVAAGQEIGLDLSHHQSRFVDGELVRAATRIYCLSDSHRRALLAEFPNAGGPNAGGKVQLLRPDQLDIQDPFGGPIEVYRKARDEIRAAVGARLPDWLGQRDT